MPVAAVLRPAKHPDYSIDFHVPGTQPSVYYSNLKWGRICDERHLAHVAARNMEAFAL